MSRMPFGKYRGTQLADLPDGYVRWLYEEIELREPLLSQITDLYRARFMRTAKAPQTKLKEMAARIIDTGYRKLAREYHPDTGGSTHTMQVLNEAIAWLRERVAA